MEKFNKLIPFIYAHEGYKSNDAADLGGLTIWGIARRFYPAEVDKMNLMDKEAAKAVAAEIYYRNYWKPLECDNYYDKVALALFDSAVNCGTQKVQSWITEIAKRFGTNPVVLTAHDIIFIRQQFYLDICARNPTQKVFLAGWMQRTLDIWNYRP
jgi:lysozyme family protein